MTTLVNGIGSKWAGDDPDTIEQLFDMLAREPLDPKFEQYGNFMYLSEFNRGMVKFWGNFFAVSYHFDVETDDQALIERFMDAISANQCSEPYRDAVAERKSDKYQAWKRGRKW